MLLAAAAAVSVTACTPEPVTVTMPEPTAAAESATPEDPAIDTEVVRVIDGDTIAVAPVEGQLDATNDAGDEHSVRLLGIDAPEMNYYSDDAPECGAQEATDHLAEMLPEGMYVTLLWDTAADRTDRYGRSLAYVTAADGPGDAGGAQIEAGYAIPWYPSNEPRPDRAGINESKHDDAVAADAGALASCGPLLGKD